jgi:jasmonate ZIM domain-containing protein
MSFRTAREEGSEEFSISGFRPAGDAFDGIKKQSSLPVISQHQQVRHSAELAVTVLLLLRLRHGAGHRSSVV